MAVIRRDAKWVYDYVSACYKLPVQKACYMNSVHPMETHDMAAVDPSAGCVVGGEALDNDFNRRILPPVNPRKRGRPKSKRMESQQQGVQSKRCSKCSEVGHYKNTCRNPRADFDADYEGDLVDVADLLGGNY